MRDFQNLLVHLQSVLKECDLPTIRTGGGLTFSGFSLQVTSDAPVDWFGYHIDRPDTVVYQIQDRILPEAPSLSRLKRLEPRRYERSFSLEENGFFDLGEREQMDLLKTFLLETVEFLRNLPPQDDQNTPSIPVLGE